MPLNSRTILGSVLLAAVVVSCAEVAQSAEIKVTAANALKDGYTEAAMLGRGEADFGFAQMSEFLNVAGLLDLGPLPASIQNFTIYAVGLHAAASSPEAAKALVGYLRSPEATPAIKKMGMEPS